ncbi:MAG TPA: hypothetical protein VJV78_29015 [Polyangiales bacterium]|nr:hypothetical protein [Polyangiales bacterium]
MICRKSSRFVRRGMPDALQERMLDHLNAQWQELKRAEPGRRFSQYHERYQQREAPYWKSMLFFATVFCTGISLVLLLTDSAGLAPLFAVMAALLLPGESRLVAAVYDRIEGSIRGRRAVVAQPAPPALQGSEVAPPQDPPSPRRATPPQVSRPTVRMAVPPLPMTEVHTAPSVRARVIQPRYAGTLKVWATAEAPQPSAAPNVTLVFFPPPVDAVDAENEAKK